MKNRRPLLKGLLAALTLVAASLAALPAAAQDAVTVFAAASLKNVLDEAGAAYTARTGVPVRFSYAASSALARQIEQGAPADVFISADADWMDYVQQRSLIAPASRRDLVTNHLALIAPAGSRATLRLARGAPLAAALGTNGRLAIAGPEVPAGRYGRAALTSLGLMDQVASRLAPAENVRAALAFVARGETPLGIVYDTDARVEPKVRIVALFPDASHPRIVYPAGLVAGSRSASAGAFLAWLEGPQGGAIFRKYAFTPLRAR
ncbi:MAG TPA: molybdate ABC transporter substrate-binding protein [Caulobacteraceae bacterium]|nr:molybdate ABC transporter substrate-binding protein [Caulobacteraceae bacterium]